MTLGMTALRRRACPGSHRNAGSNTTDARLNGTGKQGNYGLCKPEVAGGIWRGAVRANHFEAAYARFVALAEAKSLLYRQPIASSGPAGGAGVDPLSHIAVPSMAAIATAHFACRRNHDFIAA